MKLITKLFAISVSLILFSSCGNKQTSINDSVAIEFKNFKDSISSQSSKFVISIDWPVTGESNIVKEVRKWIANEVIGKDNAEIAESPENIITSWKEEMKESGNIYDNYSLQIVGHVIDNEFISLSSIYNVDQPKRGESVTFNNAYFRMSDGSLLTEEDLPSIAEIRPALIGLMRDYKFKKQDEDNDGSIVFSGLDYDNLSYPLSHAYYNDNGLVLQYIPDELSVIDSKIPEFVIPYYVFLRNLTPIQKGFVPSKQLKDYEENLSKYDEIEKIIYSIYYDCGVWEPNPAEYILSSSMMDKVKKLGITKKLDYQKTNPNDVSEYFTDSFNEFIKNNPRRNQIPQINSTGGILWDGGSAPPDEFDLNIIDCTLVNNDTANIIIDWNGFGLRYLTLKKENGKWKIDDIDQIRENFK